MTKRRKCGVCLRDVFNLSVHMRVHTSVRPYKCKICPARFKQLGHLDTHNRSHSATKSFKCKLCNKAYKVNDTLKRHIEEVHEKTRTSKVVCVFCDKVISKSSHEPIHISRHIQERPYTCNFENCWKSFYTRNEKITHFRIHTNEKPYKCEICLAEFNQQPHLRRHTFLQHRERHPIKASNICRECGKVCFDKSLLKKHFLTHSEVLQFKCDLCDKQYRYRENLAVHKKQKHVNTAKNHDCNLCGKLFFTKRELEGHLKRHIGERPYKCEICSKSYCTNSELVNHKSEKHPSVPKNKTCVTCSARFNCSRSLKIHIRLRHSSDPFRCRDCGKIFRTRENLEEHSTLSHPPERYSHFCVFCNRGFVKLCGLYHHLRAHVNETPF